MASKKRKALPAALFVVQYDDGTWIALESETVAMTMAKLHHAVRSVHVYGDQFKLRMPKRSKDA